MKLLRLFALLFVPALSFAQFTTVTGTVTDPNGLAYANGTISAGLVLPGGTSPTLNGGGYTPPTQPVGLDLSGKFTMRLGDNTVLLPGGTQWTFLICSAGGSIRPAGGKGPVCFTVPAQTISGSSQDITASITAVALALSNTPGTGTVTSIATTTPITGGPITASGTIGCATCAIGPGASTANHVAEFSGTDGVTLKDGGAAGSGTVTSIGQTINSGATSGIFTITGSPVTTSGTIDTAIAGTSGGVPYFSSGTVISSSGALASKHVVLGGGAGTTPTSDAALDDGATTANTLTYTGTSGISTPLYKSSGLATGTCSAPTNGLFLTASINTGIETFGGNSLDLCANGTRVTTAASTGLFIEGSGVLGFNGGKGQHIQPQAANNDIAGVVTLSTGAGTHSFTTAYTAAPVCVCTDQTSAAAVQCSTSTTTLTVAGTGSDAIAYVCIGNPN
jgi:hypothetical protein